MKKGVISLGEALIDFIPTDETNQTYLKSPGGAPANVAVGLAQLGVPTTFVGKVGDDVLGHFLEETLTSYGVDTSSLSYTKEHRTGLTFVTLDKTGDRSFEFYINSSADRFLDKSDLNKAIFLENKLLHIGSISLINGPVVDATLRAIDLAKNNDMLISYDPNLRMNLWENETIARKTILSVIPHVDILKVSEEELAFLSEKESLQDGIEWLEQYQLPVVFITLGAEGSVVVADGGYDVIPAMKVDAVDTTGAGDAYMSSVLYNINEYKKDLAKITLVEAKEIAEFSSVAGGLAASVKGAMAALPDLNTVRKSLNV